jgi:hypothetical protein
LLTKCLGTAGLDDEAVQRAYDLSLLKRKELASIMERFFELHDLMDD